MLKFPLTNKMNRARYIKVEFEHAMHTYIHRTLKTFIPFFSILFRLKFSTYVEIMKFWWISFPVQILWWKRDQVVRFFMIISFSPTFPFIRNFTCTNVHMGCVEREPFSIFEEFLVPRERNVLFQLAAFKYLKSTCSTNLRKFWKKMEFTFLLK